MKKILLSSLLTLLFTPAFSQAQNNLPLQPNITVYDPAVLARNYNNDINNSNNNSTSSSNANTNNFSNAKENKIVTAPGVTIKMPNWNNGNNKKSEGEQLDAATLNNMKQEDSKEMQKSAENKSQQPTPNDIVKAALPEDKAAIKTANTAQEVKRVGQVAPVVNNNKRGSIEDYNKTTLNEFEKQGQEDLQKKYESFLKRNKK